jgi:hypothetical protein
MPLTKKFSAATCEKFFDAKMKIHACALFICMTFLLAQCHTKNAKDLHGTWKVDSIYSFYNGFDMTSPGQEPLYHFQPDGRLRMTQDKEFRYFIYKVQGDSLSYTTLEDKRVDGLLIVTLDDQHLVLKKEKPLLFKGTNQQRFEIKYLSRVK